ncbi:hypothetical protein OEA41_010421 [Lepraria neglecta]|uniref:Uncharacterized protein n=1 Tax=Lepraria neglecta TaxID=209136 RepID=A0AAD9YWF1_9LECA|nr:hypothetical protein OEA41_010421 [Lepraria neglecta]
MDSKADHPPNETAPSSDPGSLTDAPPSQYIAAPEVVESTAGSNTAIVIDELYRDVWCYSYREPGTHGYIPHEEYSPSLDIRGSLTLVEHRKPSDSPFRIPCKATFSYGPEWWADFTCLYNAETDTFSDFALCPATDPSTAISYEMNVTMYEYLQHPMQGRGIEVKHFELKANETPETHAGRIVLDDEGQQMLFVRMLYNGHGNEVYILYLKKVDDVDDDDDDDDMVLTEGEREKLGLRVEDLETTSHLNHASQPISTAVPTININITYAFVHSSVTAEDPRGDQPGSSIHITNSSPGPEDDGTIYCTVEFQWRAFTASFERDCDPATGNFVKFELNGDSRKGDWGK